MTRRAAARGVALFASGIALAACFRGRGGAPRPAPTLPATPAPTDTTARPTPPPATPSDTAPRDTVSATPDSAPRPARPRRRNADDPTSRCGAVAINQGNDAPATARVQSLTDAANRSILYVGGGVVVRCRGIRNRLQSDSAEYYESNGLLLLVNNVSYDEPQRVHLTSNRLTYYTNDERLVAEGNVIVTLPTGTTMTGPNAEYLREAPGIRDRARLTATGRPTLRVVTDDTASGRRAAGATGARRDTSTIIANTILDEGDSLVYASGQVQIDRADVTATSDSATFDQGTEQARLIRNATIRGKRGRSFTLSGALIDLFSRDRELTRVVSRGQAHVVSEELDLKSDTVDLRVRESRVERAYAWGPSRATATSPERDVVADSIEAIMPDQRIRELHALRRAVARSLPDSTKIASKERDLLAGDTIVARFDTLAAAADTTRNPPVREIVAAGNARSVYQMASSDGPQAPPSINYVRGRVITVAFDSNEVQSVTVIDSASGVYFEPSDSAADSTSDSTSRRRQRPTPSTRPTRPGGRPTASRAPSAPAFVGTRRVTLEPMRTNEVRRV